MAQSTDDPLKIAYDALWRIAFQMEDEEVVVAQARSTARKALERMRWEVIDAPDGKPVIVERFSPHVSERAEPPPEDPALISWVTRRHG